MGILKRKLVEKFKGILAYPVLWVRSVIFIKMLLLTDI